MLGTFLANLTHHLQTSKPLVVGGGEFSPFEQSAVIAEIKHLYRVKELAEAARCAGGRVEFQQKLDELYAEMRRFK